MHCTDKKAGMLLLAVQGLVGGHYQEPSLGNICCRHDDEVKDTSKGNGWVCSGIAES